jgi:hypothetical protein
MAAFHRWETNNACARCQKPADDISVFDRLNVGGALLCGAECASLIEGRFIDESQSHGQQLIAASKAWQTVTYRYEGMKAFVDKLGLIGNVRMLSPVAIRDYARSALPDGTQPIVLGPRALSTALIRLGSALVRLTNDLDAVTGGRFSRPAAQAAPAGSTEMQQIDALLATVDTEILAVAEGIVAYVERVQKQAAPARQPAPTPAAAAAASPQPAATSLQEQMFRIRGLDEMLHSLGHALTRCSIMFYRISTGAFPEQTMYYDVQHVPDRIKVAGLSFDNATATVDSALAVVSDALNKLNWQIHEFFTDVYAATGATPAEAWAEFRAARIPLDYEGANVYIFSKLMQMGKKFAYAETQFDVYLAKLTPSTAAVRK